MSFVRSPQRVTQRQHPTTHSVFMALLALVLLLMAAPASAQLMCATPGDDTTSSASGPINAYWAGNGGLSAGGTSLVLGEHDIRGAADNVSVGDLLVVMQMQDGEINASNTANYGDGNGNGKGTSTLRSAGLYEFIEVTALSGGSGSGATVTFSPALSNDYYQADATPASGQKRYQVIRVPQYGSVTLAGVTAPAWGIAAGNTAETGGVVIADAQGALTLGTGTAVEGQSDRAIFVAGRGFRGAAGGDSTADGGLANWVSTGPINGDGGKGEGIAGTPRLLASKLNDLFAPVAAADLVVINSGVQGYPNGDRGRGAPGNAGGGGSDGMPAGESNNAGGGGGANYAEGGLGGRPWNAATTDTNGRGGAGYSSVLGFNRLFMGGGGSGGTNNATAENATYENLGVACDITDGRCSSGGAGGGIVILRARSIGGNGIIDVRGTPGYNVANDAAGGGGAGGSIALYSVLGGTANVLAQGGDGGNAWAGRAGGNDASARHGPGGGGGGGFVAYAPSSMAVNFDVSGGCRGAAPMGRTIITRPLASTVARPPLSFPTCPASTQVRIARRTCG